MNTESQKKAFIRDDALVLYFDTAENPIVARFDLDSLAQANFEVNKREPNFALVLKDFSGSEQVIAQFASKTEAHQALYAILQALLERNSGKGCSGKSCCGKSSGICRFFKWFFAILAVLALCYLALLFSANPVSHEQVTASTTTPSVDVEKQEAPAAPEGEAVNLDDMLSDETAPADTPASE